VHRITAGTVCSVKSFRYKAENAMRRRRAKQTELTTFVLAAGVTFFLAACAAIAHAQAVPPQPVNPNPSSSMTLPQSPETPVSPTTPGTLPGTQAGPGTSVGTNPITGQPCLGGSSSAINGGIPGAPVTSDQPAEPGQTVTGLPPNNSVYGLGNQVPDNGAC
jgi:hypothetical protein